MDAELWRRARQADGEAYAQLYRRHGHAVLNHCFRRTASWPQAEDITSVVFLETWRQRDRVEVKTTLLPWLLGVANNVIRRQARTLRRHRAALARLHEHDEPDHAGLVAQCLDDERQMARVLDAVSRLTRVEQETVALCIWAGLSYEDAALAMGIPIGTVRSRLNRARSKLRASASSADTGETPAAGAPAATSSASTNLLSPALAAATIRRLPS